VGRRRKVHPTAVRPWDCVVLGVDPGAKAGWSIWLRGKLVAHGTAGVDLDRILEVLHQADDLAREDGCPLVVLGESWGRGGRMNPETAAGMGASWGPWEYGARSKRLGIGLSKARVVRVDQRTWRTDTFDAGFGRTRKAWKELAVIRVQAMLKECVTEDRAEAILIGRWGTHGGIVGSALPKRVRDRSLPPGRA